jgi:hypothetical protein
VGSLKSDVFGDSLDAGISWALRTIQHTKAKVPYTITHFPELGATGAIEETGEARVNSFTYGAFARTGTWKHSIDVALLTTSGPTRPAAPLKAGSRKAAV